MAPKRSHQNDTTTNARQRSQRSISEYFSGSPIATRLRRQGPLPAIYRSQNSQQGRYPTRAPTRSQKPAPRPRVKSSNARRLNSTVAATRHGRRRALRILENDSSRDSFASQKTVSAKASTAKLPSARTSSFSSDTLQTKERPSLDTKNPLRREAISQPHTPNRSKKFKKSRSMRPSSTPPVGHGLRLDSHRSQLGDTDSSKGGASLPEGPPRFPASKKSTQAAKQDLSKPPPKPPSHTQTPARTFAHGRDSSESKKKALRMRNRASSTSHVSRSSPVKPPPSYSRASAKLTSEELQVRDQLGSMDCSLDSSGTRKRVVGVKPISRKRHGVKPIPQKLPDPQSSDSAVPTARLGKHSPTIAARRSTPNSLPRKQLHPEHSDSRQDSLDVVRSKTHEGGSSRTQNMSEYDALQQIAPHESTLTELTKNQVEKPELPTTQEKLKPEEPKQPIKLNLPLKAAVVPDDKLQRGVSENISTSAPLASAHSSPSQSSSDSELSFDEGDADKPWRNSYNRNVRRSSRTTKAVDRFIAGQASVPVSSSRGMDVFEDLLLPRNRSARGRTDADRELTRVAKEAQRMKDQNAELDEMRRKLEANASKLEKDEVAMGIAARTEQKLDADYAAAMDRYSLPLDVFKQEVNMRVMPKKYYDKSRMGMMIHPLIDLYVLLGGREGKADIAVSMIGSAALDWCSIEKPVKFYCIDQLYHLCIFDDSPTRPGKRGREEMTDAFIQMASRRHGDVRYVRGLPPLVDTLKRYGAVLDEADDRHENRIEMQPQDFSSLDDIAGLHAVKRTSAQDEKFKICVRNINRAFKLAAAQLENEWAFSDAIGAKDKSTNNLAHIVKTVGLCAKVMMSKFGIHVKRAVGLVVHSAVSRSPEKDWIPLRLDIAKHVLSLSSRLNLHVEMVAHMLPFWSERSLQCSFDIAFLSLSQWCQGPNAYPHGRPVDTVSVSERARSFGLEKMSFCVGDVIEVVEEIPELEKATDEEWACGLARLLKQLLTMPEVLRRRKSDEIGKLHQRLQRMRRCSNRMKDNLGVHEMRLALDALSRTMEYMCSGTKGDRSAIRPNVQEALKQLTFPTN